MIEKSIQIIYNEIQEKRDPIREVKRVMRRVEEIIYVTPDKREEYLKEHLSFIKFYALSKC